MAESANLTPFDAGLEEAPSRYVVGVDLGTTNSAVAFVDTQRKRWAIENFPVPQLVAPGQMEALDSLPSFHYQAAADEFSGRTAALRMPWNQQAPDFCVGAMARDHGALVPARLIVSAKSWLCHTGVDRTAALLPWQGAANVERLSPVEVSSRYLAHIRAAWDAKFSGFPLAEQDLVLTLPASFDEVARELTIEAAARAGLRRVVLIEEPQAAFYNWIDRHRDDWDQRVQANQKILVCDIGGGTSDFTLILVRRGEQDRVQFHRVAVGDHLILGGDNLDLALAHHLEERLAGAGQRLPPRRWDALWRQCRVVKETLLGPDPPQHATVNLAGGGSRLIGGGTQCQVTREEAEQLLLDGFFPDVALAENPQQQRSGFQEFGLPYAADPAVTRYLAAFLRAHHRTGVLEHLEQAGELDPAAAGSGARPDIVLFNGGVFASPSIKQRVVDCLSKWFSEGQASWQPQVLENERLDLAVARGAAYFGMVRRGAGVKIASGLARTYYIGVDSPEDHEPAALCLIPAGAEPGADIELAGRNFRLQVAAPVEFPLYVSSTRLTDLPGELTPLDLERLKPLAPIRTVLKTRGRERGELDVRLHSRVTEIGTMELWCQELHGERTWRLQFDVRSATQTDVAQHEGVGEQLGFLDESTWQDCRQVLQDTFGPDGADKPAGLMNRLGEALGEPRQQWAPSLLRRIWETLMELSDARRRGPAYEARWLNLVGFSLRPGYGLAVDDWRVAETWRAVQGKLLHGTPQCRAEVWILWRRIAGGLRAGQQQTLADPLIRMVRQLHKRIQGGPAKKGGDVDLTSHEASEIWRLLGSLEYLPLRSKLELGDLLAELLGKRKIAPIRGGLLWALGRIGARSPVYGLLSDVAPQERVGKWLDAVLLAGGSDQVDQFALMQMARKTGDRYRDIDDTLRQEVVERLEELGASDNVRQLVAAGGQLDDQQQQQVFGESLPRGLRIV